MAVNLEDSEFVEKSDPLEQVARVSDLAPWIKDLSLFFDDNLMNQPAGVIGDPDGPILKYVFHFLCSKQDPSDEQVVSNLVKLIRGTLDTTEGELPVLHFKRGILGWGFYVAENRSLTAAGKSRLESSMELFR